MGLVKQPIEIDSIWLTDEHIERLGGGVSSVRFSHAEKRALKKKRLGMGGKGIGISQKTPRSQGVGKTQPFPMPPVSWTPASSRRCRKSWCVRRRKRQNPKSITPALAMPSTANRATPWWFFRMNSFLENHTVHSAWLSTEGWQPFYFKPLALQHGWWMGSRTR
jgi:hypothetical protein